MQGLRLTPAATAFAWAVLIWTGLHVVTGLLALANGPASFSVERVVLFFWSIWLLACS